MRFAGCLIVQRADDWLIVVDDDVDTVSRQGASDEVAVCAALMTKMAGRKNPPCLLAPHATACYFASLRPGSDIELRDRAALTFELEDHLPIDAESMVADFVAAPPTGGVPSAGGDIRVSAIALPLDPWQTVADTLEASGIPVRSIVPRTMLVARALCDNAATPDTVELFLMEGDRCDQVSVEKETVVGWKHLPLNVDTLRRHRLLSEDRDAPALVVGATPEQQALIRGVYPDAQFDPQSLDELTTRGAAALIGQRTSRWFDLRRGALGPNDPLRAIAGPLRLVGCAVVLLLATLAVGGWWRAERIEQQIAQVRSEQEALFREAFPDTRMPAALLRRVRSEYAKVSGSRGKSAAIDIPVPATDVLHRLLAALPRDIRFRFERVRLFDGKVDLDFQVRSPVDAGALATSLSSAGFEVKPPGTTQKDSRTFDSVLEATWVGLPGDATSAESDLSVRISLAPEVKG